MSVEAIKVGNKVEIIETKVNSTISGNKDYIPLVSQIYDILDDDHFQIEMPLRGTQLFILDLRVRYKMVIYGEGSLFKCTVQVTDRFKHDNHFIAVVEIKGALKRIQRREFYRLEKLIEIQYRSLSDREKTLENMDDILNDEPKNLEYKAATVVDLSGGGARFISREELEAEDMLMIRLDVGNEEGKNLCLVAKVMNSSRLRDSHTQYENRVKFVKLRESQREKIIHYIFEQERKMRFIGKS